MPQDTTQTSPPPLLLPEPPSLNDPQGWQDYLAKLEREIPSQHPDREWALAGVRQDLGRAQAWAARDKAQGASRDKPAPRN
jgi:hypothetical protein